MLLDLTQTTFIIPIKIEHEDRLRNARTVLKFLNEHIKTKVIILEITDTGTTKLPFYQELPNLNLEILLGTPEPAFHRTKYLNIMLERVNTPVVVNYDIDVILDPENMADCQKKILEQEADVIYPYELGMGQIQVLPGFDYAEFEKQGFRVDYINSSNQTNKHQAECGHCIFFNTAVYRRLGGENENFISYGPEDKERMYRFQTLGKNVQWREGQYVYHFEHHRGSDSWVTNPFFSSNWKIFENLKSMGVEGLANYYASQSYLSNYSNLGKQE